MLSERKHQRYLSEDELRDLGFGSRVAQQSRLRLLNRNGSFNVARTGMSYFQSLDMYNTLLAMSWPRFYLSTLLAFCAVNGFFAFLYLLAGPDALAGIERSSVVGRFVESFFFSVQTFTTVGYGHIAPKTITGNVIATLDAFVGLLGFALGTGLMFARFSRPTAKIAYSDHAVISPYRGVTGFMFRMANQRKSQLIEVDINVLLVRISTTGGVRRRHFDQLALERHHVAFFPLAWTIVHPIDENSPLYGLTAKDLDASEAEFLVLLTAIDDAFAQTVHSRSSYRYNELIWGASFGDLFVDAEDGDGVLRVDLRRLDEVQPLID